MIKTITTAILAAASVTFAGITFGKSPNVILILTDDQGYGDVSAHGNPVLKTPNLDAFRKGAVRFTDFHVALMCSPTRGQASVKELTVHEIKGFWECDAAR